MSRATREWQSFEPETDQEGQTGIDGMDDKIIGLMHARIIDLATSAHILEEVLRLESVLPIVFSRVTDAPF